MACASRATMRPTSSRAMATSRRLSVLCSASTSSCTNRRAALAAVAATLAAVPAWAARADTASLAELVERVEAPSVEAISLTEHLELLETDPSAVPAPPEPAPHIMQSPYATTGRITFTKISPELRAEVVDSWPIWTSPVTTFPYYFEQDEDCQFVEGRVVVTPKGGSPVTIKAGDFVTFPKGMECVWDVKEPVRKHYKEYMPDCLWKIEC